MKKNNLGRAAVLAAYILIVLYITDFSRTPSLVADVHRMAPFWSYALWMHGDWQVGLQIVENVMMFAPFGFMLAWVMDAGGSRKRGFVCVLIGLGFSCMIETSQLLLKIGTFEFDDLFDNTLGACLGIGVYVLAARLMRADMLKKFVWAACGFCIVGGLFVCCYFVDRTDNNQLVKEYAFGIESVEDGIIKGYAFVYEDPARSYEIWLKEPDGDMTCLQTKTGLESAAADEYYKCKYDYSHCGFEATCGQDVSGDSEVYIKWPMMKALDTGECIGGSMLRMSEPEADCRVYQYGDELYWVMGPDFKFEADGSTYVQYQLNTTQPEHLPEVRIENGWDWDNIGFVFEEAEISADDLPEEIAAEVGPSDRVAMRLIPHEYAVTAIVTGYYNGYKWEWSRYFRPNIKEL